jgi:hypothetical protein
MFEVLNLKVKYPMKELKQLLTNKPLPNLENQYLHSIPLFIGRKIKDEKPLFAKTKTK